MVQSLKISHVGAALGSPRGSPPAWEPRGSSRFARRLPSPTRGGPGPSQAALTFPKIPRVPEQAADFQTLQARGKRAAEEPGEPGWLLHLICILELLGVWKMGTSMNRSGYLDISFAFLGALPAQGHWCHFQSDALLLEAKISEMLAYSAGLETKALAWV